MNDQVMNEMIANALSELDKATSEGDTQAMVQCESYLDDLYIEQLITDN